MRGYLTSTDISGSMGVCRAFVTLMGVIVSAKLFIYLVAVIAGNDFSSFTKVSGRFCGLKYVSKVLSNAVLIVSVMEAAKNEGRCFRAIWKQGAGL